jgi:release factor glutamine methyltransferase
MTIRHAMNQAVHRLEEAKIPSAHLDSELIVAYVMGRDRAWLLAHDDTEIDTPQLELFDALINRRFNREPLVHITGVREFYGLEFEITPDVLTPRVETEQIVEWAIKYAPKNSSLIDIGTGCGALAVAIKHARSDLTITATDISELALTVARRNASRHQATVEFIASDLFNAPALSDRTFGAIVTNLPYLADDADLMPEVQREPTVALFGGPDGLGLYRRFLDQLPRHLTPGGYLFTESDPWQHEALTSAAATIGLTPIEQGYFILGFQLNKPAT